MLPKIQALKANLIVILLLQHCMEYPVLKNTLNSDDAQSPSKRFKISGSEVDIHNAGTAYAFFKRLILLCKKAEVVF